MQESAGDKEFEPEDDSQGSADSEEPKAIYRVDDVVLFLMSIGFETEEAEDREGR